MADALADRPILLWLRQDLRLHDNASLSAAVATGRPVIPVFVFDEHSAGEWKSGGASRWWLGMSLPRLGDQLGALGSKLIIRRGDAVGELTKLAEEAGAFGLYFARCFEPYSRSIETELRQQLGQSGVEVRRFSGTLLFEPEAVATGAGEPYRVYSPFARAVMALPEPRAPLPAPKELLAPKTWPRSLRIEELELIPKKPDWAGGLRETWTPGTEGGLRRLETFAKATLAVYAEQRDRPDKAGTSRLSPHLHFGEVSVATCWHVVQAARRADAKFAAGAKKFLSELLWREFSYHLLHHFPALPETPFRVNFARFPWRDDAEGLRAWQRGQTGFPIVDAGMRELWQTGYMHNRVRMIVGSFLVKDLLIPWQRGEAWFWDTLVDADLANNSASWQWIAGCGADAAPYFRIFNPVKQGETFDPDGDYVRRYVPELQRLSRDYIHAPFAAPAEALATAGIVLGETYPLPIVERSIARVRALEAFARIKGG